MEVLFQKFHLKSDRRSSLSDLFRNQKSILRDRIRNFIATKYDNMVMKLQFSDNIDQNFGSVETIVNFICEKMADSEDNDSAILIPSSVKLTMKNGLQVRNGRLKFLHTNVLFLS